MSIIARKCWKKVTNRWTKVSYIAVMQQQISQEQNTGKITIKERLEFRYAAPFFWFTRFLLFVSIVFYVCLIWVNRNIKELNPISFFYIYNIIEWQFILHHLKAWHTERRKDHWMIEHKNDIFRVDENGIEWQQKDKSVRMAWNDVDYAHIKEGIYILGKQGKPESEIRFSDPLYLPMTRINVKNEKRVFALFDFPPNLLTLIILDRCPHLAPHRWKEIKEEIISTKPPRSASITANAQVFPYHTETNKERFKTTAGLWGFGILIVLLFFSKMIHAPLSTTRPLALIMLVGLVGCPLLRWVWYVKSQIETDDMGIALVEPKGVTWRVLWSTIETYTTEEKLGVLTAKDGKTYKFPLNTARASELEAGIRRRLGAD
jgi:hypothetical protein